MKNSLSSNSDVSYILRLGSGDIEGRLFTQRWLYVGVRREWTRGSKVLFAGKVDVFLGYGVIAKVQQIEELDAQEKEFCLQRNSYAKIFFSSLTRFVPPVPVEVTSIASLNPMALHGSRLSAKEASEIEGLANAKISF
jgi:hypothetical protein